MVTAKMWKCIDNIIKAFLPKTLDYNKGTKHLKLSRHWWKWLLVYYAIAAPIVITWLVSLLLDIFVDNTVAINIKHLAIIIFLMIICVVSFGIVFTYVFFMNNQYVIAFFNVVSKLEPSFGKQACSPGKTSMSMSIII